MRKTIDFPLKTSTKASQEASTLEQGDMKEERDETPPSRHRLSPSFIVFVMTTLIVTLVVALLLSPLAAIEEIQIEGNELVDDEKIIAQAGDPYGENVFLFRTGQSAQALALDPYIEKATVRRQPLHGLWIQIVERAPVGILLDGDVYLHFSSEGRLMDVSDSLQSAKLPIITGLSLESIPAPGDYITDEGFHEALAITNACSPALLAEIQEINVANPGNILAYTGQGIEVRIGKADDSIEHRMQSLEDLLEQVVLSERLPAFVDYIDIRYDGAASLKLIGYDAPVADPDGVQAIEVPENESEGNP